MYRTDGNYKFGTKKDIFYTGKVVEETEHLLDIRTTKIDPGTNKPEEVQLAKSEIARSKFLGVSDEKN